MNYAFAKLPIAQLFVFQLFSSENINQLVGMYRHETETSPLLILEIIHRVAQHSPGVVFGRYAQLIDDTKFPATSLKHRAPILASLALNNRMHCTLCFICFSAFLIREYQPACGYVQT